MASDFGKAREAAINLLLKQRLYSVKIDVLSLKYKKNIIFVTFENFCSNSMSTIDELYCIGGTKDAFTIVRGNASDTKYIVLYNDKIMSTGRQSFSLAHEIGHIFLAHDCDDDSSEIEANCFAAELTAPRILVNELISKSDHKLTPFEIANIFGISKKSAENRIKSLATTPKFSPNEHALLKKLGGLLPNFDGPQVDC